MTITKRFEDESLPRKAFDVARRSREGGDRPFGPILAASDGNVLLEQGNGCSSEGGDRTAQAERRRLGDGDAVRPLSVLLKLYADGGYSGNVFQRGATKALARPNIEIVKRSDLAMGFVVLPKR